MSLFLILSSILTLISLGFLVLASKDIQRWQSITLAIAAPILVAVIYQNIGSPQAIDTQSTLTAKNNTQQHAEALANQQNTNNFLAENQLNPQQIQQAITTLQEKVNVNPNDLESLNLLANTYLITEQAQLAVLTLEKIIALGQSDADTLIKTADAYTYVEKGIVNLRAQQLIETAIKQNPQHLQGLWLAGMASVQANKADQAKKYWNRLLPLLAGTPQEQELRNILTELEQRQPILNAEPSTATSNNKTPQTQDSITIRVNIEPDLLKRDPEIRDDHLVFIFARAKTGPRAPLAAKRLTVKELPTTITLTKEDAMLPQATIEMFNDIEISAKISKTGNPSDKTGDISSETISIDMSNKQSAYDLTIQNSL